MTTLSFLLQKVNSVFFKRIPKDQSGIREEIARMKAERLARRAQREAEEAKIV